MSNSGIADENRQAGCLAISCVSYKFNKLKIEVKKRRKSKSKNISFLKCVDRYVGRRLLRFEDEMKEANENVTAENEDEQQDDEDIDLRSKKKKFT